MKSKIIVLIVGFSSLFSSLVFAQDESINAMVLKPNFEENLKSFYVLIGIIVSILVTINILSISIKNLIGSVHVSQIPYELRKKTIGSILSSFNKGITVFIIFCVLLRSFTTLKLSFTLPGNMEKTPWLHVYKSDFYFFFGLTIVLLIMVFFLVNTFNKCIKFVNELKYNNAEL